MKLQLKPCNWVSLQNKRKYTSNEFSMSEYLKSYKIYNFIRFLFRSNLAIRHHYLVSIFLHLPAHQKKNF